MLTKFCEGVSVGDCVFTDTDFKTTSSLMVNSLVVIPREPSVSPINGSVMVGDDQPSTHRI